MVHPRPPGTPSRLIPFPGTLLACRLRVAQAIVSVAALAVLVAANTETGMGAFGTFMVPAAYVQCFWNVAVSVLELRVLLLRRPGGAGPGMLRALIILDMLTFSATTVSGWGDISVAVAIVVDYCNLEAEHCADIRRALPRAVLAWMALHLPNAGFIYAEIWESLR